MQCVAASHPRAHGEGSGLLGVRTLVALNILGAASAGYFTLANGALEPRSISVVEALAAFIYLLNLCHLLTSRDRNTAAVIGLTVMAFLMLAAGGDTGIHALLWLYTLPLASFLLLGLRAGIVFNLVLLSAIAVFLLAGAVELDGVAYSKWNVLLSYGAAVALASLNEIRRYRHFQTLERLSVTDTLTGAFNRRKFQELIDWEIRRAQRYGKAPAIVSFDIDHYKRINDQFGHHAGDEVLRHMAGIVRANIRQTDSLVRLGGDEFLILAPETAADMALRMAENLRVAVTQSGIRGVSVTVSAGVAQWRCGEDAAALLSRADRALYRAKRGGRNRVVCDQTGCVPDARAGTVELVPSSRPRFIAAAIGHYKNPGSAGLFARPLHRIKAQ